MPGNGGASGFAALGVVVSEAAELAPEIAADCESVAAVEGTKGEVGEGTIPMLVEALGIPDMAAGVLIPASGIDVDVGEALAADTVLLGLAAAAMLKSPLVANIWLMSVMLTNCRVYWSPDGTRGSSTVVWSNVGSTLFAMAIA